MTDVREIRLDRLHEALKEAGGKKASLAREIGKSPAQLSQWFSGYRTIEEESAREIERRLRKPVGWLDSKTAAGPANTALREPTPPYGLRAALEILGAALESTTLTEDQRDEISDALMQLVKRKGADRYQRLVIELLTATTSKRTKAA
jgi:transcriptional regulator with XRE-family HTH domain